MTIITACRKVILCNCILDMKSSYHVKANNKQLKFILAHTKQAGIKKNQGHSQTLPDGRAHNFHNTRFIALYWFIRAFINSCCLKVYGMTNFSYLS